MLRKIVLAAEMFLMSMAAWAGTQQPNIILVLVDDMGWGDLSLNSRGLVEQNTPQISTPHLAKLAQQGVLLTRHYTCAPVCAPARASLFSGVHQGHAEVVRNNSFDAALENSHTLASVLKQAGYATALIGKWGIGGGSESGGTPTTTGAWPTQRGFDYFFGYNNHIAGHRHYPKEESVADPETHKNAIWDGDKIVTDDLDGAYSTDLFTARAKKWIEDTHKADPQKPFFLALTLIAPHARLAVPTMAYPKKGGVRGGVQWLGKPGKMINTASSNWDSFVYPQYRTAWENYAKKRYGDKASAKLDGARRHATMITRVDDAVGDIVRLCKDLKIDRNTFLVFTSDNGPHNEPGSVRGEGDHPAPAQDPSFFRSYGPLDGIKRDAWEGGLRVPCVVWAPGIIAGGVKNAQPTQFQDWMATFAELAGVPVPMRSDGVSMLPVLRGEKTSGQQRGVVYSEYAYGGQIPRYDDFAPNKTGRVRGEQQVILFPVPAGKNGEATRWLKAIRTGISTGQEDFEIYDVDADTHESENLAGKYSEYQDQLKKSVLWNRRAYDYVRDPAAGKRHNPCGGKRSYDNVLVPPDDPDSAGLKPGLKMRRVVAEVPWVPVFETLPQAAQAETGEAEDLSKEELPAGSVTQYTGYMRVPQDGQQWHFYLTLSDVPGTKAYIKLHNFQLIDADANYKPGSTATESAAANVVESVKEKTGKAGIPLKAGLHAINITVVQGKDGSGKIRFERQRGKDGKRELIPAGAFMN